MNTRGLGPHLGLALAPIDEYLQAVKTHFRIAVRGVHTLFTVDAYIDFVQALVRQGHRIAVAEDGISLTVVQVGKRRGHLYQPKLVPQALGLDFQISDL